MMQVVKLSKKQQIALYMKQPKKKLAEMLYSCNVVLDGLIASNNESNYSSMPKKGETI